VAAAFAAVAWAAAADVLSHVDPFLGTQGVGNTFPGPAAPFALCQPGPDTGSCDTSPRRFGKFVNWFYSSGYKCDDAEIVGFSQTHLSGTGCPDLCDFRLLPFSGGTPVPGAKDAASEKAAVAYYSVDFTNTHVKTEITSSRRCGVYRFTWSGGGPRRLLVDLQYGNVAHYTGYSEATHVLRSKSRYVPEERRLYADNFVTAWLLDRTVAGVFEFGRAPSAVEELPLERGNRARRYVFTFDLKDGEPLEVKVAVSGVDSEGAARNLAAEAPESPAFASVRARTEAEWRGLLGRVEAVAEPKQLRLLYTSLYHALIQPNVFSDVDGRFRNAAGEVEKSDGEIYTGFSLWDTFRAVHPLYTLIVPEKVDAFVNSFLAQYRSVGYLPVIPYFGRETFCMVGIHSIPVIADAYAKGFRGFDAELAMEAMTNSLSVTHRNRPHAEPWVPDEEWELLERYGYYPRDKSRFGQGVSRTMEIAYDEACAASFARALGNEGVARRFAARARRWTNVIDRAVGLARGRLADGSWVGDFDPRRTTQCRDLQGDYTESCALEFTWFVPHDPAGLVELLGGKAAAANRLSDFFWKERRYVHDNEPGHHAPYFFQFMDRPDLTARIVRETVRSYPPEGRVMNGNEDCGQMGAWYVFSSLGFYPFDGYSGTYVIGAPQIPEARISFPRGGTLHIVAHGLSEENYVVRRATLNGRTLCGPFLSHAEIERGGELVFEMQTVH